MSFVSVRFFLFLTIFLAIYFLVPKRFQWMTVLCANIFFYLTYGVRYVGYIIVAIVVTYYIGILLEKTERKFKALREQCDVKEERRGYKSVCVKAKKRIMFVGLLSVFAVWAVLKYTLFATININRLLDRLNFEGQIPELDFTLPLGISIYTFVAAGYCIDVYRNKYPAEKNFLKYCTFITFFPQMVQGPFSRYDSLSKTLFAGSDFDYERFGQGALRIVWGFFKKLVIANRMTVIVDIIMSENSSYNGIYIVVLMILLPVRLYADFSGYMDIVCGLCRIMGIDLQENFRQPFFAKSIDEFWRRWHITLGAWFKDYLFYSLSMSKGIQKFSKYCKKWVSVETGRLLPSYIALIFVWSATGLWHGSTWNYLLWGWINLFCIVSSMQFKPLYEKIKRRLHIVDSNKVWQLFQMIRTFMIFGFAEMISDAISLSDTIADCISLVTVNNWSFISQPLMLFPGLEIRDLYILVIGITFMLIMDILKERQVDIYGVIHKMPTVPRYIGYVGIVYLVILFGYTGGNVAEGFMYAQF